LTEVPEHLLRRSQERRAALGLGGGDAGGASSESGGPSQAAAAPAAAAASAEVAPAPAAVAATPVVEDVEVYVPPPAPRRRIPLWVYPVLAVMPLWVFVYFGAFGTRETGPVDPLVLGAEVFQTAGCAGCPGANGQGQGDFPALNNGDTLKTFPNVADHISWVKTGSAPFKGKGYGDPNREGGQRIAKLGQMPAFASTLTEAQIEAVVQYEREGL
jgi:mono/diheme cytochrome c family protein